MIPLSVPKIDGNEWKYVKDCLDTAWVSSAGTYVDRFEERVAQYTGCRHAVASVNGTAGLHLALLQAGVKPEEYVLLPDMTFVAPANAVRYCGGRPFFIDVDPDTWQIDLDLLEEFLIHETDPHPKKGRIYRKEGKRMRVLLAVHVLGVTADMDRMSALANHFDLRLVEDASEALGSYWNGASAGSFGELGVFSFNGNKIVTTGGGGMIVTDRSSLARKAKHLSTQAKKCPESYYHDKVGYNYRLVNVLAAIGMAQMEQLDGFLSAKRRIDEEYRRRLNGVGDLKFQHIPKGMKHNAWLFTVRTEFRDELIGHLREQDIECRSLWVPMHKLPMYDKFPYYQHRGESASLQQEAVSLPSSTSLTGDQQSKVIDVIKDFFSKHSGNKS